MRRKQPHIREAAAEFSPNWRFIGKDRHRTWRAKGVSFRLRQLHVDNGLEIPRDTRVPRSCASFYLRAKAGAKPRKAWRYHPFNHGSAKHRYYENEVCQRRINTVFDVAFGGACRDEAKSRAKERITFVTAHRWVRRCGTHKRATISKALAFVTSRLSNGIEISGSHIWLEIPTLSTASGTTVWNATVYVDDD